MNAIPLVQKPPHVPEAAVLDFDIHLDAGLLRDPHERVRELLKSAPPVFWTPRNHGHWVAIGHPEIFEAYRDWEHFSNQYMTPERQAAIDAMLPPGSPPRLHNKPISADPPEHGKFRAPLMLPFGPKAIKQRGDEIRALARELIAEVAPLGHCDFMPTVAEPLPVKIFMKMLGLPLERLAEFRELVQLYLAPGISDPMENYRRQRLVIGAVEDVIEARKAAPKDDLISMLWAAEIDGQPMTRHLMEDYTNQLFIAGLDTVINGMGFGVRHLARDLETQTALRADLSLIPAAAEEILRRYSFTNPMRRVAKQVELGGFTLEPGDFLVLFMAGADLDPRAFDRPEVFDMGREEAHIAFGAGPHRCLGSHLARLELQILYEEVLTQLPPFRLDPDKPVRFHGGNILAIDSLPLRWD